MSLGIISLRTINDNLLEFKSKKPDKKIKIGFVQINNSFSGQCYLPLSVGMLQAYAQKHLTHSDDYEFFAPIYTFMRIQEAAEFLSDADIVGFSIYMWNFENSLDIARELKRRKPEVVIVFGGPQVPDSKKQFRRVRTVDLSSKESLRKRMNFTEDFHHLNPEIDICVHGEGERVFKYILEQMAIDSCHDKSLIPSASYVDANGIFHFNPKVERMNDKELAQAPSPFTTGVFDKLMTVFPDQKWVLMYETDRGCPFQCTYCDWGGATEDRVSRFLLEQIYGDIMWVGEHRIPYIFLCNANFGILERDIQIAEYFAETRAKYGYLEAVSTQNSKNPKKHTIEALKILAKAGLNRVTVMSQQSLNPATLKAVRRDNMKLDEYYVMQKQLAAEGVYTMTDIILPMPEETYQSIVDGTSTLITNGQHNHIQLNFLTILRNTEMGNPEYQERYGYEIVRTKMISHHGKRNDSISGVEEYQELVVATNTMPKEEWIKAWVFCWMTSLIYFNKLLQIPIMTLHEYYGVSYGQALEAFVKNSSCSGELPILSEIYRFFANLARDIQAGCSGEYFHSEEWLNIYWPPEEYILIKLCAENKLEAFYREAEMVMMQFMTSDKPVDVLLDSLKLNRSLIKLPFKNEDLNLELNYNIWDVYRTVLLGGTADYKPGNYSYCIDRTTERWDSWEEWCQKMVWYCNRRGAYLYGSKNPYIEIAGHH
ncbi:MAG: hypothetical protein A2651_00445 [Candidatus Yanofskybacteria bacterium RIFCSPHIGHO2_01_FULL_42_12]|uniref:Uncharacterized protein n=1 Tax=Candidatus Yanofskybacteria bacterium RIFCSPLOWO2_01_FULL_42_49 TaxID=1802694 RepID=A0A1F8G9X5_9BACT|nr:MAG: hypothetical protein A2651_00445 [Candidatus Yanofskybacteria bacterium RIFCSPHIGHO2_01_FULL_42_12]OGN22172.1 MAG: hypothetical protein A2918_03365 [Candidatus Yanofskybacteria bacterium RIFCSPLOWO2_01_FULL_42_49]